MARKSKQEERKRKIGERIETIEVKLTQIQIEDERARVIDLLQQKDELEEKLASVKADYKAKIADIDSQKAAALGAIRSGRVRKELTIEEWLTGQNEVVRVNKETGEELNRRNATARELQEELPIDTTPPPAKEGDGEKTAEDELAEEVAEDDDDESFGDDK